MPQSRGFFTPEAQPGQPPPDPRPLAPATSSPTSSSGFFTPSDDPLVTAWKQNTLQPEEAREIIDLQIKSGLMPETVARHRDAIRKDMEAHGFDVELFRTQSPKLAAWMEEQRAHLGAAQNDLVALQRVEGTVTFGGAILKSWDSMKAQAGSTLEDLGAYAVAPGLYHYGQQMRTTNREAATAIGRGTSWADVQDNPNLFRQWLAEQAGQLVPQAPLMIGGGWAGAQLGAGVGGLLGGPPGAAGGAIVGGAIGAFVPSWVLSTGELGEAVKAIDPTIAVTHPEWILVGGMPLAALDAATEWGLGTKLAQVFGPIAADKMARKILTTAVKPTWWKTTAKGTVHSLTEEAFTEAIQGGVQDVLTSLYTQQTTPLEGFWQNRLEDFMGGAAGGTLMGAAHESLTMRTRQAQWVAADALAKQQQAFVEALGKGVLDSELLSRQSPGGAAFLEDVLKDGPVESLYIPAEFFQQYWAGHGVSPDLMAEELTGSRTALAEALANGTDLVVPTAAWASKVAPTDHYQAFTREIRLRPDLKNTREVAEDFARLQREATEAATTTDDLVEALPEDQRAAYADVRTQVHDQVKADMLAAGVHPRIAEPLALLQGNVFLQRVLRSGEDPAALLAARGPARITSDVATAEQGDASVTPSPMTSLAPSVAPRHETSDQRTVRRGAHLQALTQILTRAAQQLDPTVTSAQLRAELDARISLEEERQQAGRDSGHGQDLLRAIAERGGIREDAVEGEFRELAEEGHDTRRRGVVLTRHGERSQTFGKKTWNGIADVFTAGGQTPDDMATSLARQDPRFAHITDRDALIQAVEDALRADADVDTLPGTAELAPLGIDPATAWWRDSWQTSQSVGEDAGFEGDAHVTGDEAPGTFTPDEFLQTGDGTEFYQRDQPTLAPAIEAALPAVSPTLATVADGVTLQALIPTVTEAVQAEPAGRLYVRPLKAVLQKAVRAAMKAAGIKAIDPASPAGQAYVIRLMTRELVAALAQDQTAVGWYNRKVTQMRHVLGLMHPELLTDPLHGWFPFSYALAVTSNGLPALGRNFEIALEAYEHYKRTGQMPTNVGEGKAAPQINDHLGRFNTLVGQMGLEAFRTLLETKTTVGALKKLGYEVSGERVSEPVYGAAMLGPKIGNGFYMNLNGVYDQLTMDRWFVRAWQRYLGTLLHPRKDLAKENRGLVRDALGALTPAARVKWEALLGRPIPDVTYSDAQVNNIGRAIFEASTDVRARAVMNQTKAGIALRKAGNTLGKNLDGQRESPKNPAERGHMRAAVAGALAAMRAGGYTDLSTADLQAVLWYPEKRLYETAASNEEVGSGYQDGEAPDYANAAAQLAVSRGVADVAVRAALGAGSNAASAAGRAGGTKRAGRGTPGARGAQGPAGRVTPAEKAKAARTAARQARANQRSREFRQEETDTTWRNPVFYSRLTRAVETATIARATGAQWKATIRNAKTGINQDEWLFASVDDLEDTRTYTRDEVLDYLHANTLDTHITTLTELPSVDDPRVRAHADELYAEGVATEIARLEEDYPSPVAAPFTLYDEDEEQWAAYLVPEGGDPEAVGVWYATEAEAMAAAEHTIRHRVWTHERELRWQAEENTDYDEFLEDALDLAQRRSNLARYGDYVMRGATDPGSYRESFVSAPLIGRGTRIEVPRTIGRLLDHPSPMVAEVGRTLMQVEGKDAQVAYLADQASDYRREAILARRAYETGAEPDPADANLTGALAELLEDALRTLQDLPSGLRSDRTWFDGHQGYHAIENPIVRVRSNIRTLADGRRVLFVEEIQPPLPSEFKRMPRLLQEQWRELGMKWALAQAAELGLDAVAWTPGQVQVDRYALDREVSRLAWQTTTSTTGLPFVSLTLTLKEQRFGVQNANLLIEPATGRIHNAGITFGHLQGHLLKDAVGPELAAQILAPTEPGSTHQIEADGLKVGGAGLKRLYDEDFVRVANKLGKRYGSKVAAVPVAAGPSHIPQYVGPEVTAAQLRADADADLTDWGPTAMGVTLVAQARAVADLIDRGRSFAEAIAREGSIALAERYGGRMEPRAATVEAPSLAIPQPMHAAIAGEGQALFQDEAPTGLGTRGAYNPSENVIRLVAAKANLSTLLHEFGHEFLEAMGHDVARLPPPEARTPLQQQYADDYATALREIGFQGTPAEWAALSVHARRAHHEVFARSWERYLMEGEAPSAELRPIFAKFRTWLEWVYKSLGRLNVELSPELRGVFDRLVASDTAIAKAQAETSVQPLFTDPASAGVSPEEFAAYRAQVAEASLRAREDVDRAVMGDWRKEQQADWKADRAQLRATVATEFNSRPAFVAQSVIRTGRLPDGSIPTFHPDGTPLKLSRADLVGQFGAGILARLPRPYLYAAEGGIPVDTAAELFGFASADALVEALTVTPRTQQAIDEETDARMRQQRGDELLDGLELDAIAENAVHTHRAGVIAAELQALTKGMATARLSSAAQRKANAEAQIAQTRIRDLKPGLYLAAAQRASQRAFDAFARNNRATAVQAKEDELTALALHRAARDAQQRLQAQRERLQKFASHQPTRARLGKAGAEYLEQIDDLLERYEFTRVTQKTIAKRESLRAFVKKLEAQGLPIDLPDDVLDDARRINYQELTVEDLEAVADAVEQIAHLSRLKRKLLVVAAQREFSEVVTELTLSIGEHGRRRPTKIEHRLPQDKAKKLLEGIVTAHRKIASLARELDGFQDGGAFWNYIIRPLNDAANHEATKNAAATTALQALFDLYTPAERARWFTPRHMRELGNAVDPRAQVSPSGLLMIAMNWGNATNRQRLRDGHGWTESQVQAALDTLTPRDLQFVQGMIDFIGTYWPEIEAKQTRVTGLPPVRVDPLPITTAAGTIPGGYFPLKYEGELNPRQAAHKEAEFSTLQSMASYVSSTTRRGHTKARAEGELRLPVRLDFGVIFEHVGEVIHDLTHHETLVDVGRILRDDEVAAAIYDVAGKEVYDQFKKTIGDVAQGDVPARDKMEQAINHIRVGTTVVGLGWSLFTALMQPLGLTQSMVRIGPRWVSKGLTQFLGSPSHMLATIRDVQARSEFMANRTRTQQREINEVLNTIGATQGQVASWVDQALRSVSADKVTKQAIAGSYFALIGHMQTMVDVPTWLAGYQKALADPSVITEDGTIDDAKAIAMADQAVLDAQGGGQIKDLASVQRGSVYLKLFTNFYSFFNTTFNLWTESYRKTKREPTAAAMGELLLHYALLFPIPAMLGSALRDALRGEDDPEDYVWNALIATGSYMLGTMVIARELGGALQGFTNYEGPAGLRSVASLSKVISPLAKGKSPNKAALHAAADAIGAVLQLPVGQAWRTTEGFIALLEGKTHNPGALIVGPPSGKKQ